MSATDSVIASLERAPSGKWSIHGHACHLAAVDPRFVQRLEELVLRRDWPAPADPVL